MEKYYSTDFRISITEVKAETKEEAEALIQKYVDTISPIMADKIQWDEVDWTIEENILDEAEGVWKVTQ